MKPIEDIVVTNTCPKPASAAASVERKPRPQKEQALNCPRCHSTNTKFCYYNNYSLTQPRYFCKTCRRYWTEGGSLRNIPVGGGSRKNKRSSASTCSSSISSSPSPKNIKLIPDLVTPPISLSNCTQNPNKVHEGQDLNLAFPAATTRDFRNNISELVQQNNNNNNNNTNISASASSPSSTITTTTTATTTGTTTPSTTSHHLSPLELLTGITSSSRGLNSFMTHVPVHPPPDPNNVYTCGFPLQDFKPGLNFSLDGIGSGFATSLQGVHQETNGGGGRLLFPFEDLKQVSSTTTTTTMDQNNSNKEQQGDSTGYWTGMLGGGSW